MHTLAKRIHNLAPRDVRLTFADGSTVTLAMRSAEFFRESFQAEGVDDAGTTYRLVTDGADDPLVAGKVADDGWETAGEVSAVESAEYLHRGPLTVVTNPTIGRRFMYHDAANSPRCVRSPRS